ncbi:hypothetical protein WR25_27038 [Diploscapter pachys]|uniref:Uncharacterized protein n=1 Tax=Diploscapter pachys TaxID=2018661 RepID=A0A2A2KCL4_9BILA|nr:hypothetical protein WR25_27038 [Diploscapter pachys]
MSAKSGKATTTIGIDLGTTFSCVAIVNGVNNDPEPVPNNFGSRITPSVIAYDPKSSSTLIGEAAVNSGLNPTNIIYDAKRMIGRQANDTSVEKDKKLWPFVVESKEGKPHVKLMHDGNERLIPPEKISSEVLKEMKAIAERFLNTDVTGAVITVPAYFDHRQRTETMRAAEIAGLKVLRLINEPTAAAIAYMNKDRNELNGKTVMIFDLGGGTFDVSIVKINDGMKVIAIAGHNHIGGQDFDESIMEYFKECYKEERNRDFPTNRPKLLNRLRLGCREAKHILSNREQPVPINIEVDEDEDFTCELTRAKLNEMIGPMLNGTLDIVDKAIQQADMTTSKIDLVLLIGGSTRIPKMQELLAGKFGQDRLRHRINPDEAVAIGASLLAHNLNEFGGDIENNVSIQNRVRNEYNTNPCSRSSHNYTNDLSEVTALSIGMEVRGGQMLKIIPRGTRYPCEVVFKIDINGILHVTEEEVETRNIANIKLKYDGKPQEDPDIRRIVQEAKEHEREDAEFNELINKRKAFEKEVYKKKWHIEDNSKNETALGIVKRYLDWSDKLPNDIKEYDKKLAEFNKEIAKYP